MRKRTPVFLGGLVTAGALAGWVVMAAARDAPRPGPGTITGGNPIVGVKIYEHAGPFAELFSAWKSAGINTAFVGPALAENIDFMALARKNGVATFIIFPVFFDAEELDRHPDLYAVTNTGDRAEDGWVKFVCPTRRDYRDKKIAEIVRLVETCDPDGVSLDFIRTFVFWEMVYPDRTLASLPNSCFDASCLEAFRKTTGIAPPADLTGTAARAGWILNRHLQAWTDWKCSVVAEAAGELAAAARRVKPGIKVNIHTVPWREADFGDAIRIVAGQDLARLARSADTMSPMCYHHMVKRPVAWISDVVRDVHRLTGAAVLPSIQVKEAYLKDPEPPEEFREALEEALRPPSGGVVFWNWQTLSESPEKMEAVKAAFGRRRAGSGPDT